LIATLYAGGVFMESVDIVLLNPPSNASRLFKSEHLGLAYLAAALRREGYSVAIVDADLCELTIQQAEQIILSYGRPKLIGVSVTDPSGFQSGCLILAALRHQGVDTHITAGGYLSTFWRDEILSRCSSIDSVVLGEGDITIGELARRILNERQDWRYVPGIAFRCNGQIDISSRRHLVEDLNTLPFPARDNLDYAYRHHFVATISASRGCYHRCTFCQITEFYRLHSGALWRMRSPESIAEEMGIVEQDYGVRHVLFVDDDFVGAGDRGRQRAHAIADEITRRGLQCTFAIGTRVDNVNRELLAHLQEAGLISVFLGIESGVERMLDDYAKNIDMKSISAAIAAITDLGLILRPLYITVDAFTTLREIKQTFRFFRERWAAIPIDINDLDVLRGTRLEETYRQMGLLLETEEPLSLQYKHVYPEAHQLSNILAPGYRRIYRPMFTELYWLYFLYGHFDRNERQHFRTALENIEGRLKDMHLKFLESAIKVLESGDDINAGAFLAPFESEGRQAHRVAQHVVQAWLSYLTSKGVIGEEPRQHGLPGSN
jgi:anaerobic magnesium-protoporphyrin IX monomethyl ester cyclase